MAKHPPRAPRPPGPRDASASLPRPPGSGYAAEGPGFYVWDDFASETLRSARELGSVARPQASSK